MLGAENMFPLVAAEDPWQGQNEFVCKCSGENYIYELQVVKQHQILHGRPESIAINGSEIMSHHVTSLHDIFLTMQGCQVSQFGNTRFDLLHNLHAQLCDYSCKL